MSENERKTINILWTGGFDSTFRIFQLSDKDVIIQPYYCSDKKVRKCESHELNAISIISEKLKSRKDTKAVIKPVKYFSVSDRIDSTDISSAFKKLRENDFFGRQYEWLAGFSERHPGIELSIHKDDKATELIQKYGEIKQVDDDVIGSYYILDKEKSSKEMIYLFGNYHFPLFDYTKLEMKQKFKRKKCEDIIELTWFCHTPINGKPCGTCNCCQYTIEEGMKERFDYRALMRYKAVKRTNDRYEYLLDRLKELNQNGNHTEKLLLQNHYNNIAIYGMGRVGKQLYNELINSKIKIACVIDSKEILENIIPPQVKIDKIPEEADAIIVTPVFSFDFIKESLEKMYECPIISIEKLLFED